MGLPFFTDEDAKTKLDRTIVLWDDEPYYCTHQAGNKYRLTDLQTGKNRPGGVVDYTSDKFNYLGIPLGYLNDDSKCYYVKRTPIRQVSQALNYSCIAHSLPYGDLMLTKAMYDCIKNNHEPFKETYKKVIENALEGKAFDRHFCVINQDDLIGIKYRDQLIAIETTKSLDSPVFTVINRGYINYLRRYLSIHGVVIQ